MTRKRPRLVSMLDEAKTIEYGTFRQIFDVSYSDFCVKTDLSELEFNGCTFKNIHFNQQDLDHCTLIDCVFDHCDFSNVNLSKLKTGKVSAVRFSTLEAICEALDCQPGDILEYQKDK